MPPTFPPDRPDNQSRARVTSSADRTPAPKKAIESITLFDRRIDLPGGKVYYIDAITNEYGVAVRITERTAANRNRIVVPLQDFAIFMQVAMEAASAADAEFVKQEAAKASAA